MLLQNILKTLWDLLGAVLQATRTYTIRSTGRARKPGQPHSTGNLGSFHKWVHRAAGSWVHHLSSVTVRSVQKEKHHPGPLQRRTNNKSQTLLLKESWDAQPLKKLLLSRYWWPGQWPPESRSLYNALWESISETSGHWRKNYHTEPECSWSEQSSEGNLAMRSHIVRELFSGAGQAWPTLEGC